MMKFDFSCEVYPDRDPSNGDIRGYVLKGENGVVTWKIFCTSNGLMHPDGIVFHSPKDIPDLAYLGNCKYFTPCYFDVVQEPANRLFDEWLTTPSDKLVEQGLKAQYELYLGSRPQSLE